MDTIKRKDWEELEEEIGEKIPNISKTSDEMGRGVPTQVNEVDLAKDIFLVKVMRKIVHEYDSRYMIYYEKDTITKAKSSGNYWILSPMGGCDFRVDSHFLEPYFGNESEITLPDIRDCAIVEAMDQTQRQNVLDDFLRNRNTQGKAINDSHLESAGITNNALGFALHNVKVEFKVRLVTNEFEMIITDTIKNIQKSIKLPISIVENDKFLMTLNQLILKGRTNGK